MSPTLTTRPLAPPVPTRAETEAPAAGAAPTAPPRLVSLDAYRGFIMLVMASGGFGFATMARNAEDPGAVLRFLAYQFDHVAWVGCAFWDLIQPSFMFMVGVALPYSYASRAARGETYPWMLFHAAWRALLLILLAVFLSSPPTLATPPQPPLAEPSTNWIFTNVLAQIGLGYVFVFLLVGRGWLVQLATMVAILGAYTLFFALWPLPPDGFDHAAVGLRGDWEFQTGWFAHWEKNTNAAHHFDVWFLNLFPRLEVFRFHPGGYQTLNFVPSMATMILGLMAGETLRGQRSPEGKFVVLALAAVACLALGWLLGQTLTPLVKRIWTPSWAVFSAGWTFAMLAVFYGVIDVLGYKIWAFPFVVVGMNSIAIYCMSQQMRPWILHHTRIHFGTAPFAEFFGPFLASLVVLGVLWLICYWMYQRKLFLRI